MKLSEKNLQNVQSYCIGEKNFNILAAQKINGNLNQHSILIKNDEEIPASELRNAQLIYNYHDASTTESDIVKGCDILLMQEDIENSELQDNTLYIGYENEQLCYLTKGSQDKCILRADIVPEWISQMLLCNMIDLDWLSQIQLAVTVAQKNLNSKIELSAGNKTALLTMIEAESNVNLNDDYVDQWYKFDSTSFNEKLKVLISKTNDTCIFAMMILIPSSTSKDMTHAVPFIFNKKGEMLYYCSIPGKYDKEVTELFQIISNVLAENKITNLIKHEEIILQNDNISCTFFTTCSLLSLDADKTLSVQCKPIANLLQNYMQSDASKLELRSYLYDKLENEDEQINNIIPDNNKELISTEGSSEIRLKKIDGIYSASQSPLFFANDSFNKVATENTQPYLNLYTHST